MPFGSGERVDKISRQRAYWKLIEHGDANSRSLCIGWIVCGLRMVASFAGSVWNWKSCFVWREEINGNLEKPSENKLIPLMMLRLEFEPRPVWWQMRALTTAPSLQDVGVTSPYWKRSALWDLTVFKCICIIFVQRSKWAQNWPLTVRLLQPGQLEENWPIVTLIENKR